MKTKDDCHCIDFERDDIEDSLCYVCVCGHVEEEHSKGFFRRCIFNRDKDEDLKSKPRRRA